MPSHIFFILPIILTADGIALMIVHSGYRKKVTTVLFGLYFLFNALLSVILIYSASYNIAVLESLRGFALFFTFYFISMAWNSIVIPAKKWMQYYKKMLILGVAAGTFHTFVTFYAPHAQTLLIESYGLKFSIALMVAATVYLVYVCMKRMITVNMQFLDYIMDNYSYFEESLIKYKNVVLLGVMFVVIAFLTDLLMIFSDNPEVLMIYALYQLLYVFIVVYFIFNFPYYKKHESKVTVYYRKFLNDNHTAEFNLFFPSDNDEILLDDKHDELRQRLIVYFEEEKPYISKKLIMNDVARDLNTNRTYISQIINSDFGTTFFNFVNVFRIEEAKILINAESSYSLKAIADSCGFSSYTTFVKYQKMYGAKSADWYKKLRASG